MDYRYPPIIALTLVPHDQWRYYPVRLCPIMKNRCVSGSPRCLHVPLMLLLILVLLLIQNVAERSSGHLDGPRVPRSPGIFFNQECGRQRSRERWIRGWLEVNKDESADGHLRGNLRSLSNGNENLYDSRRGPREDLGPIICAFCFWSFVTSNTSNCREHPVFPAAPGRLALPVRYWKLNEDVFPFCSSTISTVSLISFGSCEKLGELRLGASDAP